MSRSFRSDPATLRRRLELGLGPVAPLLRAVLDEAQIQGVQAYLVGGPVRDLLLGHAPLDIDLLLSDRLGPVAVGAAARIGGRAVVHGRFLTARIESAGAQLDLSRARQETYPSPGALPEVAPATIEQDLGRRDFSINAMAFPLRRRGGGSLLDPFGGKRDLRDARLRTLHPASFLDDPTRLLRGARYAARLSLRLEPQTGRAFRSAVEEGALATVSGDRIAHEVWRTLAEARARAALARLDRMRLLAALAPGWSLESSARRALGRLDTARRASPWPEAQDAEVQTAAAFAASLLDTRAAARSALMERLSIQGSRRERTLESIREASAVRRWLAPGRSPGAIDARLSTLREAALLLAYASAEPSSARRIRRYAAEWRHSANPLDGTMARRLGLRGPEIGNLLRAARRAALDGRSVDEGWIARWLARNRRIR